MSFHRDKSEENPFLLGVTIEIPALRKAGYALASFGSEVLSTSTERPGAEERYDMTSEGVKMPDVVIEGAEEAVAQSAAGMEGEYEGDGARRVWDERARRMREGALGSLASCWRKAVPTPPTPVD